jgi:hypothetical protein
LLKRPDSISAAQHLPTSYRALKDQPTPNALTLAQAEEQQKNREKTLQQRLELMQKGIVELEQWLVDLVTQGLSTVESLPESYWESFAARMVDAKLGGIARRLRQIPPIIGTEGWHETLLGIIAELHLFVQAFRQLDGLPEPMQEEVLSIGGRNIKKQVLLEQEGVKDHWLVLGQQSGSEDQLRYRRTWILGEQSGRAALLLDYAYGNQPFEHNWVLGSAWQAEIVFYPSSYPLRALVKQAQPHRQAIQQLNSYENWAKLMEAYAEALAQNPWLYTFPALLEAVTPTQLYDQAKLRDTAGQAAPLLAESDTLWQMVALSAGKPLAVFGEWSGSSFSPLSVIQSGRIIPLQGGSQLEED